MKKRYKNILEKVYEVEGLLLLAMSKDETPEGLDDLIERRLTELMDDETEPQEESKDDETYTFYALEDDDNEIKVHPKRKEKKTHHGHRRKHPMFSLNDRYLFIREIFNGDSGAFNTALDRISDSSNFEEALEYLVAEYGLNPEGSETVSDFAAVIERYFKSPQNP